jgi:histidine triad (HIT) family protein
MSAREPDCLFCKIVAAELPATIVASDERTVTFMDINPATRGHALIVPRTHARDLLEIDPEDLAAVAHAGQRLARILEGTLGCAGVNLFNTCGAAAGQTVFHFHLHVVPRYAGDGLRLPLEMVPGDPEEIAATGRELAAALA